MKPIKVFLADDHKIVTDTVGPFLDMHEDIEVVGHANSTPAAVNFLSMNEVDIIVLDYSFGDDKPNGVEAIPILKQHIKPSTHIIILSGLAEPEWVLKAHMEGVKGWIKKEEGIIAVLEGIRKVRQGEAVYSTEVVNKLLNAKSDPSNSANRVGKIELSSIQLKVLRRIHAQMTTEEIAEDLSRSKSTIESHRSSLMLNTGVKNAVGLGLFAERNGITLEQEIQAN